MNAIWCSLVACDSREPGALLCSLWGQAQGFPWFHRICFVFSDFCSHFLLHLLHFLLLLLLLLILFLNFGYFAKTTLGHYITHLCFNSVSSQKPRTAAVTGRVGMKLQFSKVTVTLRIMYSNIQLLGDQTHKILYFIFHPALSNTWLSSVCSFWSSQILVWFYNAL